MLKIVLLKKRMIMRFLLLVLAIFPVLSCNEKSKAPGKRDSIADSSSVNITSKPENEPKLIAPKHYRTWKQFVDKINEGDLVIDSIADFSSWYSGEMFNPDTLVSFCESAWGDIELFITQKNFTLTSGKEVFDLNKQKSIPDDNLLAKNGMISDDILYQFTSGGHRFSFFRVRYSLCSGTFCSMVYYFLIDHDERGLNVFLCYNQINFKQLLVDVDGDRSPDFLCPEMITTDGSQLPHSDTTEYLRVRVFSLDKNEKYRVKKKSNGDTLEFHLTADMKYFYSTDSLLIDGFDFSRRRKLR